MTVAMENLYSALEESNHEIRLLIIHPPSPSDQVIKCSLETVSLNEDATLEFSALSYVWGNENLAGKITINGVPMVASTNLVAALRVLRTSQFQDKSNLIKELPKRLWVDALCINQEDVSERNSQVQLMRKIYSRAVRVISWLGLEADGSTGIISLLKSMAFEINQLGEEDDRYEWVKRYPHLVEDPVITEQAVSKACRRLQNIDALWRREYWKRTWILQEVVLARDILIVCGEECIPWQDVTTVDKWLASVKTTEELPLFVRNFLWPYFAEFLKLLPGLGREIEILRRLWKTPNNEAVMKNAGLRILRRNVILQATDPRDKIYGLLGLLSFGIVPDYDKSVRDVYVEAAIEYLKHYGLAETINQAGIGHGDAFGLPSWVPNWDSPPSYWRQGPGIIMPTTTGVDFVLDTSKPHALQVLVFQLGEITDIDAMGQSDDDSNETMAAQVLGLAHRALLRYGQRSYPTGIPILQAIMRLILGDGDLISHPVPGGITHLEIPSEAFFNLALAFEFALCSAGTPRPQADNELYAHNESYSKNLQKLGLHLNKSFPDVFSQLFVGDNGLVKYFERLPGDGKSFQFSTAAKTDINRGILDLTGRRFFYVKDRYVGLGPPGVKVGDIIGGITGCPFPVILRRFTEEYRYVGRCCVEGWGQLVKESVRRPVEIELL